MDVQLTSFSKEEKAHNIRSNCDMCGKEIFLERVSNSYINREGERIFVIDVTDKSGRCMRCRMIVIDTIRAMDRIARIGE